MFDGVLKTLLTTLQNTGKDWNKIEHWLEMGFKGPNVEFQKQLFTDVFQNRYSLKFRYIHGLQLY